jgi:hypothetical protein
MKIAVGVLGVFMGLCGLANAQLSCEDHGNSTYCNNGQTFQRNGNYIYDNHGNSWQRNGNSTYGSRGTSYQQNGNTTYDSNGNSWQRNGDYTFGSNGTTCQRTGTFIYCNLGRSKRTQAPPFPVIVGPESAQHQNCDDAKARVGGSEGRGC